MAQTHSTDRSTKSKVNKIIIPEEILTALEAVPDKPSRLWSDWEIEVLRIYGRRKSIQALRQILHRAGETIKKKMDELGL